MQRPENAILWFSPQRKVAQIDVRLFFVRILNHSTQSIAYQPIKSQTKLSKRHSDTISHTISPTFPLIKTPKYGVPVVGTVFFSDLCNDYPINYEDPTTRTAPARSRHPRTAAGCGHEHRPPLRSRIACPVMSPAIQNHRTCTIPQTSNSAS